MIVALPPTSNFRILPPKKNPHTHLSERRRAGPSPGHRGLSFTSSDLLLKRQLQSKLYRPRSPKLIQGIQGSAPQV
jgi:hypothetical protein